MDVFEVIVTSNDSYSRQDIVEQVHDIPHLNSKLVEVSNTFDITPESTWNEYTKSLLPMPIICLAIALLSVLVFQCTACCMCCCAKKPVSRDSRTGWANLRNCRIVFSIALLIVLFYDQSILFGSKYLGSGVSTADDGLDYISNTFTLLTQDGDSLTTDGNLVLGDFNNAYTVNNCNEAGTLSQYMDDYFTYVNEYTDLVSDIPGKCTDAQDVLHKYGVDYKNKTIYVFYAMFIVCIGLYAVGMCFSSKGVVYTGFLTSDCVMIFTFIICGVTMILLMLLADFCMEPTDNLLMIAPDTVYNVTAYYTTCTGTNPLEDPLQSAAGLTAQAKLAVQTILATTCPNDAYLLDSLDLIDNIDNTFVHISGLISCPPNQDEVLSVLNDGVCGDVFKGVYTIWLGQFACAAGVLLCSIIVACAVPSFSAGPEESTSDAPLAPHVERDDEFYSHSHNIDYEGDHRDSMDSADGAAPAAPASAPEPVIVSVAEPVGQPMVNSNSNSKGRR